MKPVEWTVKVLVVGAVGVGKTSILNRYLRNHFSTFWKATIGVDFGAKTVRYNDYTKIHLHFWDVGGQERFTSVTRVYYQNAGAIIIAFDVTRESTLVNDVLKWKEDIYKKMDPEDVKNLPIILVGNKADVVTNWSELNKERMEEIVKENKFSGWTLTSAKQDSGIETMVNLLIEKVLENKERLKPKYDANAFKLKDEYYYVDEYYDEPESTSKCKCVIS
jgi:Ras-related protein Rab-7L1